MLGKKIGSVKKLAKKVKAMGKVDSEPSYKESLLMRDCKDGSVGSGMTPTGFFAVYVGEERQRFMVPTRYLSHPLFRMLLEKGSDEFGFEQRNGLAIPCTVSTFHEVVGAVEDCNGRFDFGKLVEEFI